MCVQVLYGVRMDPLTAAVPVPRRHCIDATNPTDLRAWWGNPSRWTASDATARFVVFAESVALLQNLRRTDTIHRVTVARMLGMDATADRFAEARAAAARLDASDTVYEHALARIVPSDASSCHPSSPDPPPSSARRSNPGR